MKKNKSVLRRYIGVDLHRDSFLVCVRESGQEQFHRWSLPQLAEFAGSLRGPDELAVEATGNTRWFCQALADRVRQGLWRRGDYWFSGWSGGPLPSMGRGRCSGGTLSSSSSILR